MAAVALFAIALLLPVQLRRGRVSARARVGRATYFGTGAALIGAGAVAPWSRAAALVPLAVAMVLLLAFAWVAAEVEGAKQQAPVPVG